MSTILTSRKPLYLLASILCFMFVGRIAAQSPAQIDVDHYSFDLTVSDDNNEIRGIAEIQISVVGGGTSVLLDLIQVGQDNMGMQISSVSVNDTTAEFTHANDKIEITLPSVVNPGDNLHLNIVYSGEPRDGLIISTNKHGDRTFFGDNWPNRARNWLPVVDRPGDKATVEFRVTAPDHYQVVASGRLREESNLGSGTRLTHWSSSVPLATKVMIVGIARFSVDHVGVLHSVPVQSWVYPQEQEDGFYDYEIAWPILDYFVDKIGPFPYEKLANVQSKTIYGGMENAGAIFYHENSIDGERGSESLFAHEIAHQWFGDSVTEQNFHHVWLSEGFATYFTHLYLEHTYGVDRMQESMSQTRQSVINYARRNPQSPVVDTTITVLTDLLSANSYQKGGWVLHMLRREIGDNYFWAGIRDYYETYRDTNAWTSDFRFAMEAASGVDLGKFFEQWIFTPSVPNVEIAWSYNVEMQTVEVRAKQSNSAGYVYELPIEIRVTGADGTSQDHSIRMSAGSGSYTFESAFKPVDFVADPNVNLLAEFTVSGPAN